MEYNFLTVGNLYDSVKYLFNRYKGIDSQQQSLKEVSKYSICQNSSRLLVKRTKVKLEMSFFRIFSLLRLL